MAIYICRKYILNIILILSVREDIPFLQSFIWSKAKIQSLFKFRQKAMLFSYALD